jgi:hypothetical protein
MKRGRIYLIFSGFLLIAAGVMLFATLLLAQKVEMVNGVRVVHNKGKGVWGKKPAVRLEPVRKLGDIDSPDPNTAFYLPSAVAVDAAGNIYVLDTGNNRIQKFSPDGKFLSSFGRFGQGPAEFNYPSWLDIDTSGNLCITDPFNERVQVLGPDGKDIRTIKFALGGVGNTFVLSNGNLVMEEPLMRIHFDAAVEEKPVTLPKLIKVLDQEGKLIREFGEKLDMKEELLTNVINQAVLTVDDKDNVYLVFPFQNRIEKYSADGKLLWRADRELAYSMEVQDKGSIERKGGGVSVRAPKINQSSVSVAVDGKGRVWVVTMARQLKKEEEAGLGMSMSMSTTGGRTVGYKAYGNTELRQTDAYKLEIFDPDGVLLGEIALSTFVEYIFIYGDRLFLVDKLRGASVQEFRIKE